MILCVCCGLTAQAQTATDANEGVRLTADAAYGGSQRLTWWGRVGRTYFVQQSYDLVNWTYVPVVHGGGDAVDGLNFFSTDDRLFWRLQYTDAAPGGLYGAAGDADADGLTNYEELTNGTNPFSADSDGDGITDDSEVAQGTDPTNAASRPAFQSIKLVGDSGEGVRKTKQMTITLPTGAKSYLVIIAAASAEYPSYTGDQSQFDDVVDWKITPTGGTEITGSAHVNDLNDDWDQYCRLLRRHELDPCRACSHTCPTFCAVAQWLRRAWGAA